MKFAKLFEDTKYGQILVRMYEDDEEKVKVSFTVDVASLSPDSMLGQCSVEVGFKGDSNWDAAEKYLAKVDLELALKYASVIAERIETALNE